MAVTFAAAGALANNATTVTLACVAPACLADDILICAILGKDNQVITVPDGTWTKFVEVNNTANQRVTLAWKRATGSGGTFNFTKPVDNNLLFCGVISAWRGCITGVTPIDASTPTASANASSDTVTYATFDPTETSAFVVAIGVYNNDLTTAGSISGTDPTFANNWDLETATGSDGSIFGKSGSSTGAATGARSHTTTSTADDVNIGIMFGLVAAPVAPPITCSEPVAELVDTTDALVYTMGTFVPEASSVLVVLSFITGSPATAGVVAGGGLSWTEAAVGTNQYNTTDFAQCFWAKVGTEPTDTVITHTRTGTNATGCVMMCFQFGNASMTGGGSPIRQAKFAPLTGAANPAVVLDLTRQTLNGYCAGFGINRAAPAATPPTSWTEICDTGYATPNAGAAGAFRAGGETSTLIQFTAASGNSGMIAVEVYVESGVPGGQPMNRRWGRIPGLVGGAGGVGRRM